MLSRNDQPYLDGFNFASDSVFNNIQTTESEAFILPNDFLLLDTENFYLLNGTQFLLFGS